MNVPKLMLVTPPYIEANHKAFHLTVKACQCGVSAVQLRAKDRDSRHLLGLAAQLRKITSDTGTFFTVNERLDIALAVNADGIHLPEGGLPPEVAKRLNPRFVVGVSVHSLNAGLRAEKEGADYVVFGPIFHTPSKMVYGHPQGVHKLKEMVERLSIPVIAIGGISPFHAQECLEVGAHGVAAIGAFTLTSDVQKTIDKFLCCLDDPKK